MTPKKRIKELFGIMSSCIAKDRELLEINTKDMNKEEAKSELIKLLENQITDLVAMSKIELGDDVIEEIKRLKAIIKEG